MNPFLDSGIIFVEWHTREGERNRRGGNFNCYLFVLNLCWYFPFTFSCLKPKATGATRKILFTIIICILEAWVLCLLITPRGFQGGKQGRIYNGNFFENCYLKYFNLNLILLTIISTSKALRSFSTPSKICQKNFLCVCGLAEIYYWIKDGRNFLPP